MKKLFLITTIVLAGVFAYGQLDTLNTVGSGVFNGGGDPKRIAYEKTNDVILQSNVNKDSLTAQAINFTTGDINVTDDATIADDASVGGDLIVTGTLGVTGASTLAGASFSDDVSMDSTLSVTTGLRFTPTVLELTAYVSLDSTIIAGTAAGDIGHSSGATLVAAPGSAYTLEFVSAVLIYDHSTSDFAGGGDDNVIQNGSTATALSAAIAGADLLEASGDKMVTISALSATDQVLVANMPLSLQGTALTNDAGTAAGALRVHITYKVHTTGL